MSDMRQMIDEYLAAGHFKRIPDGDRAIKPKINADASVKFRPEHCGVGGQVFRHRHLDEQDSDFN